MTNIGDDALRARGEALYITRPWDTDRHSGRPGVTVMKCHDCEQAVAVTAYVVRVQRERARRLGATLTIVCDDCGVKRVAKEFDEGGGLIAEFPS